MLSTGDTLAIPIINNQYSEELLVHDIMRFISRNPSSYDAVLVRNHGLIVWGKTWEKAEQLAKSMDALFRVAMKLFDESKPWVINRRCSG
ncbi:unnamed protein product [Auanema sp. JU1783]|nr:unnamed protein product [Auanema sp. JU1783]